MVAIQRQKKEEETKEEELSLYTTFYRSLSLSLSHSVPQHVP
jgi:hypothetical protein